MNTYVLLIPPLINSVVANCDGQQTRHKIEMSDFKGKKWLALIACKDMKIQRLQILPSSAPNTYMALLGI